MFIKKILSLMIILLFTACSSIGIKPTNDNAVLTVLQKSAISTVGYLVAKNNPGHVEDFKTWYDNWKNLDEFVEQQANYQLGTQKLSELISDDPFLQMQIKNAMSMIKVDFTGPQVPADLGKYQEVVDFFMIGVNELSLTLN